MHIDKGNVESAFSLSLYGTNLFFKPLISLITGEANQAFLSQVGQDLSKDTAMAIMDEVNRTANNSTEGIEEAAYVRTIPTSGTEVIDELTVRDRGYPSKQLKTIVPPGMETISDPVMANFISRLQIHLNHSAEVTVGAPASISLLTSKIGDVQEDRTTIWCAIGDIMKKLVSHGAVLDNIDLDSLMKEAREAHILNVNIKTSVDDAMAQATSEAAKVGSISAILTQLVTPGAEGCLDSMNHALNMGDQNIGVLQQTLTGLCHVFGNLEQKIHHMSQNVTAQLIKGSSTSAPRDDFEVRLSTLTAELDEFRQITEGGGFNTVVGYFKSLTDVTVWVRANFPLDAPKVEHFNEFGHSIGRNLTDRSEQ